MSTEIDPFGELPKEDRDRATRIYEKLRSDMDAWIGKRVEALGQHVSAEAERAAATVVAQTEIVLQQSVDESARQLKAARARLDEIARGGLDAAGLKAACESLDQAVKALEADVAKRRAELQKWGANMSKVAATAAKAAIKLV